VSLLDLQARSRFDGPVVWHGAAFDILDHNRPSPLSWAHSRSLSIAILRRGELDSERWAAFARSFRTAPTERLLLFVLGAVDLGAAQRRRLTEAIDERHVAAIVDSVVGRGMVTSLAWAGVAIESYPISRIREALATLDPESEGESVEQCLDLAARLIESADLSAQLRDKLTGVPAIRSTILR
jgi:hypothetical protein